MSGSPKEEKGTATAAQPRWLTHPKLLTAAAFLALLLILTTDASTFTGRALRPSQLRLGDYLGPISVAAKNRTGTPIIFTSAPNPEPTTTIPLLRNWISAPTQPNFTANLLARWLTPGGEPCRDARTAAISLPSLDGAALPVELSAGEIHEFPIRALDSDGRPRCLGGDYFETDLSGESWKSRPPVADHGNGSYSITVQVHPDFAGDYNLTIILLFRSFEGLKFSPVRFKFRQELRKIPIRIHRSNVQLPDLKVCSSHGSSGYRRDAWSGRWTRHARNDSCQIDHDGRFRCLAADYPCKMPWCEGALGALESNGWVYSSHCSFRIFNQDSAWKCLRNRWVFFWGDSNHVDTIRNMLNFVLGLTEIKSLPRRFDMNFTNPRNSSESVRITSIFNGHWNDTKNYLGLRSLQNDYFRQLLWRYMFSSTTEGRVPDTMILNSGLHDGVQWKSIRGFAEAAEFAARFWEGVMEHVRGKGMPMPRLFYRTTIATGGYARDLAFNPNKMEAFNGVFVEKLKEKGLLLSGGGVIDEFDMTFPWHYDNSCNDGVHYGRAPAKARWRDGKVGHQYFVDLMLAHVLLNAICYG